MALYIPVPHNLTKSERDLSQTIHEIIRRAVDGTHAVSLSFNITITPAGGGLILTTPNGLHTYKVSVANNGALESTKIS
jgi:uncharacterized protein YukJ